MPITIQESPLKNRTNPDTTLFKSTTMLLDILTRFQQAVISLRRSRTFESKVSGKSRPALPHAFRFGLIRNVEDLAIARFLGMKGSPDGAFGDDIGGCFVVEGIVSFEAAREGDFGAFAFDGGVDGEVGGPVGGEIEGTAVGDESDLRV